MLRRFHLTSGLTIIKTFKLIYRRETPVTNGDAVILQVVAITGLSVHSMPLDRSKIENAEP